MRYYHPASFEKRSAIAILPFARIAAREIPVNGEFEPKEIEWAFGHVVGFAQRLNTRAFNNIDYSVDVNRRNEIRLTALLARANPSKLPDTIDAAKYLGTAWWSERKTAKVAMTEEQAATWCESPAAKKLMFIAEDRRKTREKIWNFENLTREKQRLVIGVYRNVKIFREVFIEELADANVTVKEGEEVEEIARRYIDAAYSLVENFQSEGLNIKYAASNLPYLAYEYEESGQLFRVFTPFLAEDDADDSDLSASNIKKAKSIAMWRSMLQPPDEPEYPLTPEVQGLISLL